jgi:hypothetical protein
MASREAGSKGIVGDEGAQSSDSPRRPRVTIASIMGLVALVAACCTWPLLIIPVSPVVFASVLGYFFPRIASEWLVVVSILAVLLGLLIPGLQGSHHHRLRPRPAASPATLPGRVAGVGAPGSETHGPGGSACGSDPGHPGRLEFAGKISQNLSHFCLPPSRRGD